MYSSQTARFLIDSGSTTDETLSTFLCLGAQVKQCSADRIQPLYMI